jgi:hypothetical protein
VGEIMRAPVRNLDIGIRRPSPASECTATRAGASLPAHFDVSKGTTNHGRNQTTSAVERCASTAR